jgi:4-hydroxy-3-methylbut-2-en-1-yl diphosphate reductase
MKSFVIPEIYKSNIIGRIKQFRRQKDKLKKDFTPTLLDFGSVRFLIARHFGFCYGVENAVEIAYRALEENPDKRIFLLSEMIHNPDVNADLIDRGMRFIKETDGTQIIPWSEITPDDIVIVPAFGTTVETYKKLNEIGVSVENFDTTCPFVEKVWNRAEQIGQRDYTVVIHGQPKHEETKATFSHSQQNGPAIIVRDMIQAGKMAKFIQKEMSLDDFMTEFSGQFSSNFKPERDLQKIGVVNQTTMLASETQAIADFLKQSVLKQHNAAPHETEKYFANTRDTLCYATNDNQEAVHGLLAEKADLVVVVGGYKSANTMHLVELCEHHFRTFFIESAKKIVSKTEISHFDIHSKSVLESKNYLPANQPVTIMLTCGASCPDSIIEGVMLKLWSQFEDAKDIEQILIEMGV